MVPIYLPPVVVPHDVLEEEKAIIAEEGWFHVAGRYIQSAPDADNARRVEAERRVRENQRLLHVCAFCFDRIPSDITPVVIAMRNVHPDCGREFVAWTASDPQGWNPRWSHITDETPVEIDGEICAWGDLMLADRKTVELSNDGRLEGGYPF